MPTSTGSTATISRAAICSITATARTVSVRLSSRSDQRDGEVKVALLLVG